MGSLDVVSAKKQFLQLVDSVSSRHLPSFAIWLDSKLAEYKVNGCIIEDDAEAEKRSYPEWISKSLRENLSFCLPQARPSEESSQTGIAAEGSEGNVAMNVDVPANPAETFEVQSGEVGAPQNQSDQGESGGYQDDDKLVVKIEIPSDDEVKELESLPLSSDIGFQQMSVSQTSYMTDTFSSTHHQQFRNEQSSSNVQTLGAVPFITASLASNLAPISSIAASDTSQSQHLVDSSAEPVFSFATSDTSQSQHSVASSAASLSAQAPARSLQPTQTGLQSSYTQKMTWDVNLLASEKTFRCSFCSRMFRNKRSLEIHIRVHTKEKPFHCPYCQYSCSDRSNCVKHQGRRHPDKPTITRGQNLTVAGSRKTSAK